MSSGRVAAVLALALITVPLSPALAAGAPAQPAHETDLHEALRATIEERSNAFSRERALTLLEPASRGALEAQALARSQATGAIEAPGHTLGAVPHPLNTRSSTLVAPLDDAGEPVTAGTLHSLALGATEQPSILMLRVAFPGTDPDWEGDGTFLPTRGDDYYEDLGERFLDYYGENSGDRFQPDITLSDVYTMPEDLSLYGCWDMFFGLGYFFLLLDAVATADAEIDFSQYDHVLIMHAGYGEEADVDGDSPCDIWSAYIPPELTQMLLSFIGVDLEGIPTNDGVYVSDATFMPQSHDQDGLPAGDILGVLAHEYGHQLGLPDLYDRSYSTIGGVGKWSLMSAGGWLDNGRTPSHLDAWSKVALGFKTPTVVAPGASQSFSLAAATADGKVLKIPADGSNGARKPQEYFLVENRQASGFDAFLPGSGALIWHVDETVLGFDNDWATHRLVELEEADGDRSLDVTSLGEPADAWASSVAGFSATSTPGSANYAGLASGVTVSNIGASGATMSVQVTLTSATNSDAVDPVLHDTLVIPFSVDEGIVFAEVSDDVEVTGVTATVGGLTTPLTYIPVLDGYSLAADDFVEGHPSRIWFGFPTLPGTTTGAVTITVTDGKNDASTAVEYLVDLTAPVATAATLSERLPGLAGETDLLVSATDDDAVAGVYVFAWHDEDFDSWSEFELTQAPDGSWPLTLDLAAVSGGTDVAGLYYVEAYPYDAAGNWAYVPLGGAWFSDDVMPGPALTIAHAPWDEPTTADGFEIRVIAFCDCEWSLGLFEFFPDDTYAEYTLTQLEDPVVYQHTRGAATEDDVGYHYLEVQAWTGEVGSAGYDARAWDDVGYFVDLAPPVVASLWMDGELVAEGGTFAAAPHTEHTLKAVVTDDLFTALVEDYDLSADTQDWFLQGVTVSYGAFQDWPMTLGEDGAWTWTFLLARGSTLKELGVEVVDFFGASDAAEIMVGPVDLGEVTGKLTWKNVPLDGFTVGFEKDGARVEAKTGDDGAFGIQLGTGTWTVPTDLGQDGFALDKAGSVKVLKNGKVALKTTVVSTLAGAKVKLTGAMAGVEGVVLTVREAATDETVATCDLDAPTLDLDCDGADELAPGVLVLEEGGSFEFVLTGATVATSMVTKTLQKGNLVEVPIPVSPKFGQIELKPGNPASLVPEFTIVFSRSGEDVATCLFDVAEGTAACEGAESDGDLVQLEAGKYDVLATADEMKPLAKKGVVVKGGVASPLPLKFLPQMALVTVNLKTAGIQAFTVTFDGGTGASALAAETCTVEVGVGIACESLRIDEGRIVLPEGKYTVTASAGEDYKAFQKKGFSAVGGKAAKLDVAFVPIKAAVTLNLKTAAVEAYSVSFLDAANDEVGACDVDVALETLECEGVDSPGYPVVFVPEGKVTVRASAGDDYKTFEKKGLALKGGKTTKVDLKFVPRKAPVTLNLKAPGVTAYSVVFNGKDAVELGSCDVDAEAETVACEGGVAAGTYPVVLVPDGKVTVVADAGEDWSTFTKTVSLTGGKAAKVDVAFKPNFAVLTVALSNTDVPQFEFDVMDGATVVETCSVDRDAETSSCGEGLLTPLDVNVFKVPDHGTKKLKLVFRTVGDLEDRAADVVVKEQTFTAAKKVKANVKFVPNLLKVTVKGAEKAGATVTLEVEDAEGDIHEFEATTNAQGQVTFAWIVIGDATVTVTAATTSAEKALVLKAGANATTVTLA